MAAAAAIAVLDVNFPAHLRPVRQLGRGAYGTVFLCKDTRTDAEVAVKHVKNAARHGKSMLREIHLLARLKHENLLSLLDLPALPGPDFEDVYLVLPYLPTDLHKIIQSKQSLSDKHVQALTCQIVRGLTYLHATGVAHRDLKPANILLTADCRLKICDFGLSRGDMMTDAEGQTQEQASGVLTEYVVTRWYRAPEVMLLPKQYSVALDMWSVGCILCEILGRKALFPGRNHVDMIQRYTRILGTPPDAELNWLPHSEGRRFLLTVCPKSAATKLSELYPRATADSLDLASALLRWDPCSRLSAKECQQHRYLRSYLPDPSVVPEAFDWSFDSFRATKDAVKTRLYEEVRRFGAQRDSGSRSARSLLTPDAPKKDSDRSNAAGVLTSRQDTQQRTHSSATASGGKCCYEGSHSSASTSTRSSSTRSVLPVEPAPKTSTTSATSLRASSARGLPPRAFRASAPVLPEQPRERRPSGDVLRSSHAVEEIAAAWSRSTTPLAGRPVASACSRPASGTRSRTVEQPQSHESSFRKLASARTLAEPSLRSVLAELLPSQASREPSLRSARNATPQRSQCDRSGGYPLQHAPAARESSRDNRYPLQGYSLAPAAASRESSRDKNPLQGYALAPAVAPRESSRDSRSGLGSALHATPPPVYRTPSVAHRESSRDSRSGLGSALQATPPANYRTPRGALSGLPPQPSLAQSRSQKSCASHMQPARNLTPRQLLTAGAIARLQRSTSAIAA